MLTFTSTRGSQRYCDGLHRRDFLKVGTLGLSGLGLNDLLQARAEPAAKPAASDTAVVLLWLDGGASQIETFDPKPDAPEDFRSLVGNVQTNVPGTAIGGLFPKLAKMADRLAIVRSFAHADESHGSATHWVKTGYPLSASVPREQVVPIRPAFGSIVSRMRGANHPRTALPTYLEMEVGNPRRFSAGSGGPVFLGKEHAPFRLDQTDAVQNMALRIPEDRMADRKELLAALDHFDRQAEAGGMDGFRQQAFNVLLTGKAKEAFDVSREDAKTRAQYGAGLGQRLLQARRLCEAGAGFVSIYSGEWDNHSNFGPMTTALNRNCPPLDQAVSAFLEDVRQRGLEKNILLVITSEFGRTPRINGGIGSRSFGREHWPRLCPLVLAGGGLKMGQVIGQSTSKAEMPKARPVSPQDLMATLFQYLGIDLQTQFNDLVGRPIPMIEHGQPMEELF
jgi:uncharacterized protein (DUF1501 family)